MGESLPTVDLARYLCECAHRSMLKGRGHKLETGKLVCWSILAVLVTFLAGCGGGDDPTTVTVKTPKDGPSAAEDRAAIKRLMASYGGTAGSESCTYFLPELIEQFGGPAGCRREYSGTKAGKLAIESITLDGDAATVRAHYSGGEGKPITYSLAREGELSDPNDGWKIADFVQGAEDSTTPETESPPQTPEQKAATYRNCIEGRGAKDVQQDEFPSVNFSGGGSRVHANFGSSEEDAKQGLAVTRKRKPFFAERFGTVVLFTVADPLAADLDLGLACVKKIG